MVAPAPPYSYTYLCNSRGSTTPGSEVRPGVGGADPVVSEGSHNALCTEWS